MARTGKTSKALMIILLLSILLLSACQQPEVEVPAERALSVEIMEVAYGDLQVRTTLTGQVHPLEEVRLAPKVPGTVSQVHVSVGDRVQAGNALVTLDQRDLQNSIRQSEAAFDNQKQQSALPKPVWPLLKQDWRQFRCFAAR